MVRATWSLLTSTPRSQCTSPRSMMSNYDCNLTLQVSRRFPQCQVIDCNNDDNDLPIHVLVEHAVFCCTVCVQEFCEGLTNLLIPAVPGLFKAVQGFEQVAYLSLTPWGHEAQWLPHIDHLGESSIEIHILHIHLVHLPVVVCSEGQH